MIDPAATTETALRSSSSSALLTFVVADIRGYTRFAAEYGDAAAVRLSEHFLALCRQVVQEYSGEVFGSAGDQALGAFPSARAALHAALALQALLAEEQQAHPDLALTVGIGLDTGEGMRIGGDYRGTAINLAARLCSLAGPGEIFASETVIAVAHRVEGIALIDRGEVRLKGLTHPIRVIQLFPEGAAPGDLPPLEPILVTQPTNLPDSPTPFIGRSRELVELAALLGTPGVRLVTLTGPGGTGKTRLALQVGSALLHNYRDGVFFCDLSALTDPALVPSAVATVLGVQEEHGTTLVDALSAHLGPKHLLLVLDNCEQVREAAMQIGLLLDRCRELSVLATSRVPLHLARERAYTVGPLPVPDPTNLPPLNQLSQYDAVALFIDRAQAANHGFTVTNETAPAVAGICHRLDGLPLAIELAAARIRLFPPHALLQRLDRRLTLLTGGATDRPTRQQTLRNAIEWSYSLLTGQEQRLFARLSVFVGGWTFEAAETVCDPEKNLDPLGEMAFLVEWGLVRSVGSEEPRFSMLETVREYASEKLRERGEETRIRDAHACVFLALAETADSELKGAGQVQWLNRLGAEHENLRSALTWFQEHDDGRFLRLAAALWRYWEIRGFVTEGRGWLEPVVNATQDDPEDQRGTILAKALNGAGNLAFRQGEYARARELHERSLRLRRGVGDIRGIAGSLNNLGNVAFEQGRFDDARDLYAESLRLYRELADTWAIAGTLGNLGKLAQEQGQYAEARELTEESLRLSRTLGESRLIANGVGDLARVALGQKHYQDARELFVESLRLYRELADSDGAATSLVGLACVAEDQGRGDDAREFYEEAVRLHGELRDAQGIASSLVGLASLASAQHAHERATILYAAAGGIWDSSGVVPRRDVGQRMHDELAAAEEAVGADAYRYAWERGRAMSLDEMVEFALRRSSEDR